jgi:hypothetical protein
MIGDYIMAYIKSFSQVLQIEDVISVHENALLNTGETMQFECRDFTDESGCKEMNYILKIKRENTAMLSHLYFTHLEPFFKVV